MEKLELSETAKEARRKYQHEWAAKNREKQKEYTRRYWEKKAAELQEQKRCQECGQPFTLKRSDAKFCSTRCRVQHNRTHRENKS